MKYSNTLIAVRDMEKSKQFYHDILGLNVILDFGANVTLTGGIALQTLDSWKGFIHKGEDEIIFGNNTCELYFEEDDMDTFIGKLTNIKDIEYVHPLFEHSWGQRVVRFYDLDKHIIEVGENINMVIKRFIDSGLSIEETAARMDVPVSYIELELGLC
ncbi:MAG: VOC family protein [Eubacteriales bacterium]